MNSSQVSSGRLLDTSTGPSAQLSEKDETRNRVHRLRDRMAPPGGERAPARGASAEPFSFVVQVMKTPTTQRGGSVGHCPEMPRGGAGFLSSTYSGRWIRARPGAARCECPDRAGDARRADRG